MPGRSVSAHYAPAVIPKLGGQALTVTVTNTETAICTVTEPNFTEKAQLSLYLGKTPAEVTPEQVDAVVSMGREAEAWDLTDAVDKLLGE